MKRQPVKLRTRENGNLICELLAEGRTLRQIAREIGCDASAISHWLREDQDAGGAFSQQYARARDAGYEKMADEIIAISDADCTVNGQPDNALVQKQRLQVDSRKWLLSKMLPKKYGDKITQEITGDASSPLISRIELVPVASPSRPGLSAMEDGGEAVASLPRALPNR
jgi:transposase-like protein